MATLTAYFTKQIAQTMHTAVTTGQTSFTDVYERVYSAEVLAVEDDRVTLHVKSYDNTPSGSRYGGRDQRLGDHTINIQKLTGLTDFWQRVITAADPSFARRYGANVLHCQR